MDEREEAVRSDTVRDVGLEDTAEVAISQRRAHTELGWPPAPPSPVRITRRAAIMRAITASKIE
jgi:hypothetical protein